MFVSRVAAGVLLCLCLFLSRPPLAGELLEQQEGDPPFDPESVAACFNLFSSFDPGTVSVAFDRVFYLYVSNSVEAHWSAAEIEEFILAVMDDDSTNADDVFPAIWDYFCFSDADPRYSKVDHAYGNRIYIYLYYSNDFTCGQGSCQSPNFCQDQALRSGGELYLPMKNRTPEEVANFGFAHELQHLCFAANGLPVIGHGVDYLNITESLSTYAEHMRMAWQWSVNTQHDQSYDSSVYSADRCEPTLEYYVWRVWMGYLLDHIGGPTSGPTDDAVYRWVRAEVSEEPEVSMRSLADVLSNSDYAWLGGGSGDERLQTLFQYFAVAKFANAPEFGPDNRFGYENGYSPVENAGFFKDLSAYACSASSPIPDLPVDCPPHAACDTSASWNVRILPPDYQLGQSQENTMTTVSGIYTAADGSHDYVDVPTYGTDYIIFRSGSYFQDSSEHELRISLEGDQATPPTNNQVKVWVIGYNSTEAMLQDHPEDIVFIEPVTVPTGTTLADIVVTDFGRSIKSVVVVVTLVETVASTTGELTPASNVRYFHYSYDYGVYSPASANVTWAGTAFVLADRTVFPSKTLTLSPGTIVRVALADASASGADTQRIELNVDGEVVVNGTAAAPVTILPWTQATSEDWAGFYFSGDSDGGTFNYCTIGYAEYVIDSYAPISIENSTIRGASDALISMWSTTLNIDNSEISLSNGDCIRLDDTQATIDSTTVEDYSVYGLYAVGNEALSITNCEFLGDSVGVHVENNTTSGVIANTTFSGNHTAISYYASTEPDIDECVIMDNTVGVRCDYYASPTIAHCITSTNYAGDISNNGAGIFCTDGSSPGLMDT